MRTHEHKRIRACEEDKPISSKLHCQTQRESVTQQEMREIAAATGITYEQEFILPNVEKITD